MTFEDPPLQVCNLLSIDSVPKQSVHNFITKMTDYFFLKQSKFMHSNLFKTEQLI